MANVNASATCQVFTGGSGGGNAAGYGPVTGTGSQTNGPTIPSTGAGNGVVNDLGTDVVVYYTFSTNAVVVLLTYPGTAANNPQTTVLTGGGTAGEVATVLLPPGGVIAHTGTLTSVTWVWVQKLGQYL